MINPPISVSVPADSGNIEVQSVTADRVGLAIRRDHAADFRQWFFFRVCGARGRDLHLVITNAASTSYAAGWAGYQACVSADLENWVRVPTTYEDGQLIIRYRPTTDAIYVAYFAAYPLERARAFTARAATSPLARLENLGASLDGEALDSLIIGDGPATIWVIARQHPGESMASWWMEGFLPRLLDPADSVARAVRAQATVYVVPLVNPDGVRRGNLRTNAAGADLNREWAEPAALRSPEVLAIRNRMDLTGCDLFLDVHGDEVIANNFIAGTEGIPSWDGRLASLLQRYLADLSHRSPAFQTVEGYPIDAPGKANLKIASNAIGERFRCLAMTLEMPFKDATVQPDPVHGWSPGGCRDLGRACLDACLTVLPALRDRSA